MRWLVVLSWACGTAALTLLAPSFGSGGDQLASIIPLDSPAIEAEIRSVEEFGFPLSSRTAVVQHDPAGLSPFTQAASVLEALSVNQQEQPYPLLGALPLANTVPVIPGSPERGTAVLTYLFMNPSSSFASQEDAAYDYIETHLPNAGDSVVGVVGSVPARAQQASLVTSHLPRLELLTVVMIFLLLGVSFRSILAPVVALTAAGVAFLVTLRLSGLLGVALGLAVPAELKPLLVALLLGIVTDYTIFYVLGLEARVRSGGSWTRAVQDSVASFTPIVTAAGLTVAAGTAALLAAESAFFRAFGPAMAMAVLVGLCVSVTLIPALMAILGPRLLWPRRITAEPKTTGSPGSGLLDRLFGPTSVEFLTRRPVALTVLAVCVGLLFLAALPLRSLNLGVGFTQSLPESNSVKQAAQAAEAGFAPGITAPTTILFEGAQITRKTSNLIRIQDEISRAPGVAGVIGPRQNLFQEPYNVVLSRSGNAARMLVVFDSDPLSAAAIKNVEQLRARLPGLLAENDLGSATVAVAGDTAIAEGLISNTQQDLWRIGLAALAVNLLLLIGFLRALVAPLFLLASSVLVLAASLGITVWVFGLLGTEELTFYVPFAAAVLLVSLGSDYNIFGVGQVWEEARRRPMRAAIIHALPQSSRAIGAAGLTLAVSFGLLVLIPLRPFRELALVMSLGIMLDAVVVRSLLVPSLLTLVGRTSGWPGRQLQPDTPLPPKP